MSVFHLKTVQNYKKSHYLCPLHVSHIIEIVSFIAENNADNKNIRIFVPVITTYLIII